MNKLNVYFLENQVGILYLGPDGFEFSYTKQWLENKNSFAVSQQLPLEDVSFVQAAQTYFSNLLPEGKIRNILAKRLGISESNDYELLKRIGVDCAGALSLLPADYKQKDKENLKVSLAEIYQKYKEQPIIQLGFQQEQVRLSLAGAQDKIALIYKAQENDIPRFEIPQSQEPSTHILKIPSKDYKNLVENEKFVTELAKLCDLPTAPQKMLGYAGTNFLLIERYDRFQQKDKIVRLHQEDFCQSLGIGYQHKYQSEGGPSFKESFQLVENVSSDVIQDIELLLKWLIFNVAVGNCDNHGKNLSLLKEHEKNKWSLAPFYDFVCTRLYKTLSHQQAMSVGGEFDTGNLALKHWQKEMDGLNYKFIRFKEEIALPTLESIRLGTEVLLTEQRKSKKNDFYRQLTKAILTQTRRTEKSLYDG